MIRRRWRGLVGCSSFFLVLMATTTYASTAAAPPPSASTAGSSATSPNPLLQQQLQPLPSSSSAASQSTSAAASSSSTATQPYQNPLGAAAASIMGESALVDKETGRIYWEGGSTSTLTESIMPKLRTHVIRMEHSRATILSALLWMVTVRYIAGHVDDLLWQTRPSYFSTAIVMLQHTLMRLPDLPTWMCGLIMLLYGLEAYFSNTRQYLQHRMSTPQHLERYLEQLRSTSPKVEWKVRSFRYELRQWMSPIAVVIHGWRQVRESLGWTPPPPSPSLSYLASSASSGTASSTNLDSAAASTELASDDATTNTSATTASSIGLGTLPGWLRRKKITQVSTGCYNYTSCEDKTMAGLWKRAKRFVDDDEEDEDGNQYPEYAPFIKIIVTKLLVLANSKARQDYFDQQGHFVAEHCQEESMAEFATSIDLEGFQAKLLAVRDEQLLSDDDNDDNNNSNKDECSTARRLASRLFTESWFWCFTALGLTVPYRWWFDTWCDEIRVTIIKETSSEPLASSSSHSRSWFPVLPKGSSSSNSGSNARKKSSDGSAGETESDADEEFRTCMENLKLYSTNKNPELQKEAVVDVVQSVDAAATVAPTEDAADAPATPAPKKNSRNGGRSEDERR